MWIETNQVRRLLFQSGYELLSITICENLRRTISFLVVSSSCGQLQQDTNNHWICSRIMICNNATSTMFRMLHQFDRLLCILQACLNSFLIPAHIIRERSESQEYCMSNPRNVHGNTISFN